MPRPFPNPSDGYAYNWYELNGIMALPVEYADILNGLRRRGAFFAATPGFAHTAAVVTRALAAEALDPKPHGMIEDAEPFELPAGHPDRFVELDYSKMDYSDEGDVQC